MRYLFFYLSLVGLVACQSEQVSGASENKEESVVDVKPTEARPSTAKLEEQFKKMIVDSTGAAIKFYSEEENDIGHYVLFRADRTFEADGEVLVEGKWRFTQEGQLELYYYEKDKWYPVPFKILGAGSFKLQNKRMKMGPEQ